MSRDVNNCTHSIVLFVTPLRNGKYCTKVYFSTLFGECDRHVRYLCNLSIYRFRFKTPRAFVANPIYKDFKIRVPVEIYGSIIQKKT
jgi:hypothetical protein